MLLLKKADFAREQQFRCSLYKRGVLWKKGTATSPR